MVLASDAVRYSIKTTGNVFRIRYYTETTGSVWDDERTLTASGANLYISGAIQKMDSLRGSEDQVLVEQGRLRYDDSIIYVAGSIQTTSGVRVFTIALSGNSANERVYKEVLPGAMLPTYFGENPYKKIYVREIQ